MSFPLADLKKSVRKAKDGYQVTPARSDGRAATFKIEVREAISGRTATVTVNGGVLAGPTLVADDARAPYGP